MEFTNKQFSEIFWFKLTKVRRWAQALLPPDVVAKRRSGYARKITYQQAWELFLLGNFVENNHYSIERSIKIISDLREWMKLHGFYAGFSINQRPYHSTSITISNYIESKLLFTYTAREIFNFSVDPDTGIHTEKYTVKTIDLPTTVKPEFWYMDRHFEISHIFDKFLKRLKVKSWKKAKKFLQ